jgi:hypothetical protein
MNTRAPQFLRPCEISQTADATFAYTELGIGCFFAVRENKWVRRHKVCRSIGTARLLTLTNHSAQSAGAVMSGVLRGEASLMRYSHACHLYPIDAAIVVIVFTEEKGSQKPVERETAELTPAARKTRERVNALLRPPRPGPASGRWQMFVRHRS